MLKILALATLISLPAQAEIRNNVVYGDDHRIELHDLTDPVMLSMVSSSVALIDGDHIAQDGDTYRLLGRVYGEEYRLCRSERFDEQRNPAFCSGVLVGPDLVLTAGHCLSESACQDTKFVFGFAMDAPSKSLERLPAADVYGCKEIVSRENSPVYEDAEKRVDYSLVRLDRPVLNRSPARLERTGGVQAGDKLFAMGYPAGLPLKIITEALVRSPGLNQFQTNLDTYGGNSGSPVFNHAKGTLEGLLIQGEQDFRYTPEGCSVSKVCLDNECEGEWVTKADVILAKIGQYLK